MTSSHTVPRHHHPARSKNVIALLALLLSTLLLMLAARIAHADPAGPSVGWAADGAMRERMGPTSRSRAPTE